MKKVLIIALLLLGAFITATAIPKGRYRTVYGGDSYAYVYDNTIGLSINGHDAGNFTVIEEKPDGTFSFKDAGGQVHSGRWYVENGVTYLILGNRKLYKE